MRKFALFLIMLLSLTIFCTAAGAQTFSYSELYASFNIPEKEYTLITAANFSLHPSWVASQGLSADALENLWQDEGVRLVAVPVDGDGQITVSAFQDEESIRLFDLDQQSSDTRADYRLIFSKNEVLQDEGYTFKSADWNNAKTRGRFLVVSYTLKVDGRSWSGYQYRTIRNGYTIVVDCRVPERSIKNSDRQRVDDIMETFTFSAVIDKPASSVPAISLTSEPPLETNTGKFTVSGTCEPGLTLTAVMLRMSSPDPIIYEDTASKSGKFSFSVELPEEGVWLMTMTVQNGGVITEELVFNTTTYKSTLLPVNLTSEIPSVTYDDTLTISGTTLGAVEVQCLFGLDYAKTVKTSSNGKFTFKLDTKEAGEYDIVLVFARRNMATRRFTYTTTRIVTDQQFRDRCREEAVKPSYSNLKNKLSGYTGRTMGYDLYVVDVFDSDGKHVILMAMTKKSSGYSNFVYVVTDETPDVEIGSKLKMYGECIGEMEAVRPDGTASTYPAFELFFFDN